MGSSFAVKSFARVLTEMHAGCQSVTSDWVSPSTLLTSMVPINSGAFIAQMLCSNGWKHKGWSYAASSISGGFARLAWFTQLQKLCMTTWWHLGV